VVIVAEVTDLEEMRAVMSDKDIMEKVAKEKHTVLEPITVSMPVPV
jgi:hypothetical protein